MEPHEPKVPNHHEAWRIAYEADATTLLEYAAKAVPWSAPIDTNQGNYVALHDRLSDENRIVLEVLRAQGEIIPRSGYYRNDYWPGPALVNAITQYREETKHAAMHAPIAEAEEIAKNAGYATMHDYAAAEIRWIENRLNSTGGYVAITESLNEEQRTVLNALRATGDVKPPQPGYYKNAYQPEEALNRTIAALRNELISKEDLLKKFGAKGQDNRRQR
jgi:hypothetical protein